MGFGLPAAIGAQLARPDARVACITGDGSLMMMIHELATLRRYNLPVKIVVFDNGCLGLVRQWQEGFFGNRESEIDLSDNPDFLQLARVFGIPGRRLEHNAEAPDAIAEMFSTDGPFLLHCLIERQANVWPIVPPGKANHQMLSAFGGRKENGQCPWVSNFSTTRTQ
jgi:acetolactate synthase-1/2/3 large subunit